MTERSPGPSEKYSLRLGHGLTAGLAGLLTFFDSGILVGPSAMWQAATREDQTTHVQHTDSNPATGVLDRSTGVLLLCGDTAVDWRECPRPIPLLVWVTKYTSTHEDSLGVHKGDRRSVYLKPG